MMKYVTKIKAKLNIRASKKTSALFDGSYKSIYTGNGFDFENLREYIPGDNIRDIDWKSSSRSRNILVKRYVAERKHNVLLVFDAGEKMGAHTAALQSKKEVALFAGGTLGYLAGRNGDQIGALYCCNGHVSYYPLRPGMHHLEHILTMYDRQELAEGNRDHDAKSGQNSEFTQKDLEKSLNYIIKNINKKMIVLVVTDMAGIYDVSEETLKKLTAMNDVLFVSIGDASLTSEKAYQMEKSAYVPEFISQDKRLRQIEQETCDRICTENEKKLLKYRIVSTQIDSEDEMAEKLTELLERHKYAGNR